MLTPLLPSNLPGYPGGINPRPWVQHPFPGSLSSISLLSNERPSLTLWEISEHWGLYQFFTLDFAAGETEARGWEGRSLATYSGRWVCCIRSQHSQSQPSAVSTFLSSISPRLTLTMPLSTRNKGKSANPPSIPG